MVLRLYNTAARKKEPFQPLHEKRVGLYVCGVTVYDLCHIGHARSAIVFDVLVRYLRARGFEVTYVRNFTDVDDKIIQKANQAGKDTDTIVREYIDAFYEDMGRLGVLNADHEPRATAHVNGMIDMISTLLDRGVAYVAGNDVYFSVEKCRGYGELSGRKLEDMKAGSRIAVDRRKHHPMDFSLWKEAKPGEPSWPSPWGEGRPGWHLECSVMSNHYLGPTFDIHGGGKDLLFPHHENERAQSISANGGKFARYWVHHGFVTVDSEKMSKSLGNFLTIRDALEAYHPEVLRLFLLSKHYRTPIDFSKDAVIALQAGLVRIYRTLQKLEGLIGPPGPLRGDRDAFLTEDHGEPFLADFVRLMDDDLNTAGAVGLVFEKVRALNRAMEDAATGMNGSVEREFNTGRDQLLLVASILGFLQVSPEDFFKGLADSRLEPDPEEIRKMVDERRAARAEKDWASADAIRDRLLEKGVILEDGSQGTTWRLDV
ncbi:MAG: cysteine--tRNA ligase [Desulfatiglandaceae bacterium]